jgi:hypothetical protein
MLETGERHAGRYLHHRAHQQHDHDAIQHDSHRQTMRVKPSRKIKKTQNIKDPEKMKRVFFVKMVNIDRSSTDEVSAKSCASCQRGLTDGLC